MDNFTPITVNRRSSREERAAALHQIYYQVLERQPYQYERRSLAKAETDFLKDKIGVRRFLKELGHSEVYLNSFYHNSTNLKFLESCFRHFMGRAPVDQQEIQHYSNILMTQGVNHLITAILDSEEYRKVFGCFTVPYARKPKFYESPKAYLESDLVNHERFGQRGRTVPTLYWHQLGLNCDGGVCMYIEDPLVGKSHPEVGHAASKATPHNAPAHLQEELLELLSGLEEEEAKRLMSSIAAKQMSQGARRSR
jgi:hypothetical protein